MPATKDGRVAKSKQRQSQQSTRRVQSSGKRQPLVERTNALRIEEFISNYVSPLISTASEASDQSSKDESFQPTGRSQQDAISTPLDVYSAATIPDADLEACLDLVQLTSGDDYAASGMGWSRPKKRSEMRLPDMKYLIVRGAGRSAAEQQQERRPADEPDGPASSEDRDVLGFLSFMVTYEDGKEVVYCYEIHLSPTGRGKGLGALLMSRMEAIGRLVGVEKAMLTVFKSNTTARRFYEKGGYEVDEYSPQPRKLRNGTVKEFDYLILSKRLKT
ncbi:uncharacterized protein N7459_005882 [Penicillium hispanicum]|uniref:uncharacterized protein n=1 Tax=Penicillium hispanicum TaxID=1080232 RepID=UPI0025418DBB|nr:uncharacterized protein N7459_005882 [Penicillium hispanicum]KAJ5579897.1 hypothetical protein N7459_005882 [Penicillium hispanicum]